MKYQTIDEAIEIANGTRFGLGASVFGPDQYECIQVAKRLRCGMVAVNDFGVFYVCPETIHGMILIANVNYSLSEISVRLYHVSYFESHYLARTYPLEEQKAVVMDDSVCCTR